MSRSSVIMATLSRRQFLKVSAGAAASLALAACAPPATTQPAATTGAQVVPTPVPVATQAPVEATKAPAVPTTAAFKTGGVYYEYAPPARFTDLCDFTNLNG